jgi:flagellar motor switch protein FliG
MNNLVKAKVIVELLDDRKYSVLSSFTSQELSKLNGVDLDILSNLSNADVNKTIGDFLNNVEKRKDVDVEDVTPDVIPETKVNIDKAPKNATQAVSKKAPKRTISEKIKQQPPQLLACILKRVDEDTKLELLSHIDEEKKLLIDSIEVENTPISEQVIQVILNELEIKPNQP